MQFPDSPLSLWLDTYGPYTPEAPVKGEVTVDVAIIGGGFTGVATACELKRADAALKVALLEARTIGYGASGRNGSFAMTVVGLGFSTTAMLRGKQFLKDAYTYMVRAVETLDELIQHNNLDCDRIRPGFLRVATAPPYVRRLRDEIELMHSLGFDDFEWLAAETLANRVRSQRYVGAMFEPRLVLVNPAKLVREERHLALELGAAVYENTPVLEITSRPNFTLKTPDGVVRAEKLVFATNAYSHLFRQLRRKQSPAFTYMVATEPLTRAQLEPIGWRGREGIEDARNLIHYYRLTPDNRLVMGGGPVGLTFANNLDGDRSEAAWRHLEEHIALTFPSLKDARITHRWGGPFSVTLDLTPALGYLGDKRGLQPRMYRTRRLDEPSECPRVARSDSGAPERSARVSVRESPRHPMAARADSDHCRGRAARIFAARGLDEGPQDGGCPRGELSLRPLAPLGFFLTPFPQIVGVGLCARRPQNRQGRRSLLKATR
jgi:glycine/D-amino acid oxidase-like deaminating enzyme